MTIRIVLADDERMVRTALRAILAAEPGLEVVGEAATGAEAVSVVRGTGRRTSSSWTSACPRSTASAPPSRSWRRSPIPHASSW